jgi:hypothetical protein
LNKIIGTGQEKISKIELIHILVLLEFIILFVEMFMILAVSEFIGDIWIQGILGISLLEAIEKCSRLESNDVKLMPPNLCFTGKT